MPKIRSKKKARSFAEKGSRQPCRQNERAFFAQKGWMKMNRSPGRALLMMGLWALLCLMLFAQGCVSGEVTTNAEEAVPGCVMESVQDPVRGSMVLQTYGGRYFLVDGNHLGWDIALPEGRPIYPIGCGTVRLARAARGYGTLVVVLEHRLATGFTIENGVGGRVFVDRFLSIYGHLRPSSRMAGQGMGESLHVGDVVMPDQVIGYVENRAMNGDGAEHLHLGIRLQSATEAMQTDPTAWFRGYDATPSLARWFADPKSFLERLRTVFSPMDASLDAGLLARDGGQDVAPSTGMLDALPNIDRAPSLQDGGTPIFDVGHAASDVTSPVMDIGREGIQATMLDVGGMREDVVVLPPPSPPPPAPSPRLRYEFRIQSPWRVTPPFRLRDQWWRPMTCLNTGTLDPVITTDGFARCDVPPLTLFDGSVFLPDHPDWGDRGQVGTVANVPERCSFVSGAEWRITDLVAHRMVFSGPVSGLRCISVGTQDRLQLP